MGKTAWQSPHRIQESKGPCQLALEGTGLRPQLRCITHEHLLLSGVMASVRVLGMLGIEPPVQPEFGFKPRTPLKNNRRDNTEIDVRLGQLLVEAKLTESDFQSAGFDLISRY